MKRSVRVFAIAVIFGGALSAIVSAQNPPAGQTATAQTPGRAAGAPPQNRPVVIGPPAPVPPQVAIPRPTQAERDAVNAAVKKFIDADKSPNKALLQKFESLLMLRRPYLNVAATYTQTTQRMTPRHEGFVEI